MDRQETQQFYYALSSLIAIEDDTNLMRQTGEITCHLSRNILVLSKFWLSAIPKIIKSNISSIFFYPYTETVYIFPILSTFFTLCD